MCADMQDEGRSGENADSVHVHGVQHKVGEDVQQEVVRGGCGHRHLPWVQESSPDRRPIGSTLRYDSICELFDASSGIKFHNARHLICACLLAKRVGSTMLAWTLRRSCRRKGRKWCTFAMRTGYVNETVLRSRITGHILFCLYKHTNNGLIFVFSHALYTHVLQAPPHTHERGVCAYMFMHKFLRTMWPMRSGRNLSAGTYRGEKEQRLKKDEACAAHVVDSISCRYLGSPAASWRKDVRHTFEREIPGEFAVVGGGRSIM
mmetsp:Transcript_29316/g.54894  ORF Transcript_29316/g.54894 Transcript_29316/m.54894 type:complete len:262 (-) Transcript_29316:295-1080(-)